MARQSSVTMPSAPRASSVSASAATIPGAWVPAGGAGSGLSCSLALAALALGDQPGKMTALKLPVDRSRAEVPETFENLRNQPELLEPFIHDPAEP